MKAGRSGTGTGAAGSWGRNSDTPYYVLGPGTTGATESLTELADEAFDHIALTELDELVRAPAAGMCLTGSSEPARRSGRAALKVVVHEAVVDPTRRRVQQRAAGRLIE